MSQFGSGTRTAIIDISTISSILCVVKKGTSVVVSKEIPASILVVGDSISLGTSANVLTGQNHTNTGIPLHVTGLDGQWSGSEYSMLAKQGTSGNIGVAHNQADNNDVRGKLIPDNLYADLTNATAATISYSATNTFTLTVSDENLTLYLVI